MWMNNNHPYFYIIHGLIKILLVLIAIVSVVLSFFNIDWWWKLILLCLGLYFLNSMLAKAILITYIDEYESKK